jgi:hypothetical protein
MQRGHIILLLPIRMGFISKSQRLSRSKMVPLVLPGRPYAEQDARAPCPVCALIAYETPTRRIRKRVSKQEMAMNPLFFISYRAGYYRPIHPATIPDGSSRPLYGHTSRQSSLLPTATTFSQSTSGRGIAASLALFSDVTLSDILDAAMWKGHTTFSDSTSRFYLYRRRVVQIGPHSSFPPGGAVPGSQVRPSGVHTVTYRYQVT